MFSIAHTLNAAFLPDGEPAIAEVRRAGLSHTSGLFWLCAGLGVLAGLLGLRSSVMPSGSVIWLLAGAPVVEEVIFRLGLHEEILSRLHSAPLANALTALAFAAAHGLSRGTPQSLLTLLPALAIGAMYQRSRRLAPSIALHATFNAVWLTVPGLAP